MVRLSLALLATLLATVLAAEEIVDLQPVARQAFPCASSCRFRLCRADGDDTVVPNGQTQVQRGANTAVDPFGCLPGKTVGRLILGEALVRPIGGGTPIGISKWSPPGLTVPFRKNFFTLFPLEYLPQKQGVGRRKARGNQLNFIGDLCVDLPIKRYDLLRKNGRKIRTVRGKKRDCVSFQTSFPAILVELTWDSGDDFDVQVTEPDDTVIDFNNKRSRSGRLLSDDVGSCTKPDVIGKEQVRYFPGPFVQRGSYSVVVSHNSSCGPFTRWRLRIIVNGKVVVNKKGRSKRANRDVLRTSFTF